MSDVVKCGPDGWCPPMESRLNAWPNARQKGLSTVVVTTTGGDWADRCIGVLYRTAPNDRGLMLNNCPWCGTSLEGMRS